MHMYIKYILYIHAYIYLYISMVLTLLNYVPLDLMLQRALSAFVPGVLYLHSLCALLRRLAPLTCAYLRSLKSFYYGSAVHQKHSFFQELLKALHTVVLFLCVS